MNWAVAGDLLLILVPNSDPVPEDVFVQFIADVRTQPWTKCIGFTMGGIDLTSIQRSQIATEFKGKRTAAVTDNSVARGVATALGWLGLQIRAWPWNNVQGALGFLGGIL